MGSETASSTRSSRPKRSARERAWDWISSGAWRPGTGAWCPYPQSLVKPASQSTYRRNRHDGAISPARYESTWHSHATYRRAKSGPAYEGRRWLEGEEGHPESTFYEFR